jgi:uncharacterized membrane protein YvbJ
VTATGYCPTCGKPRTEQLRFCRNCGFDFARLDDEQPTDRELRRQVAKYATARTSVGCRARVGWLIGGIVGFYLGLFFGERMSSPPNYLLALLLGVIGFAICAWIGAWLVIRRIGRDQRG